MVNSNQITDEEREILRQVVDENREPSHSKFISFAADDSLRIALDRMSDRLGISRSDLIRSACWSYLRECLAGGQQRLDLDTRQMVISGMLEDIGSGR